MEFSEQTLEELLNKEDINCINGILDIVTYQKRFNMAYQILHGLQVLHDTYRLIHRDLSLESIHISHDGTIKIGDLGWASETKEIAEEYLRPFGVFRRMTSFQELPIKIAKKPIEKEQKEDVEICENYERLFMAPEQELQKIYSQKADIYSLGLILLALFLPVKTVSERIELIKKCKTEGPPKEFRKTYKELSKLIQQLVTIEPSIRPSISTILSMPIFRLYQKQRTERSYSLPKLEDNSEEKLCGEFRVTFGNSSNWKTRYLYLNGKKLFLYKKKGDAKARIIYPLLECNISIKKTQRLMIQREKSANLVSPSRKSPKRALSLFALHTEIEEPHLTTIEKEKDVTEVIVDHPAIESMCIEFFGTEKQRANWISCLTNVNLEFGKSKSSS